jgi:hypothetical protein
VFLKAALPKGKKTLAATPKGKHTLLAMQKQQKR